MSAPSDVNWLRSEEPPFDDEPSVGTPIELLHRRVESCGGRVGLVTEEETVTYAELLARAQRFASLLGASGHRGGDRVVLCCSGPELPPALLGTWMASGIAVVLPLQSAPADLCEQLRAARARTAVVPAGHIELVHRHGGPKLKTVLPSEGASERLRATGLRAAAGSARGPGSVALLYYAPGASCGAMYTCESLVHNALAWRSWARLGPDDGVLAFPDDATSIATPLLAAIGSGAPLVLLPEDPSRWPACIRSRHATFATASEAAIDELFAAADAEPDAIRSLRKLYVGCPEVGSLERSARPFGLQLHRMYGPAGALLPTHAVPLGLPPRVHPLGGPSMGLPLPGIQAAVLHPKTRLRLRAEEVGELFVRGRAVHSGYWESAERTAESLWKGWVRTERVGFLDEDGWFYDLARPQTSDATTTAWAREFELVLAQHPDVRSASARECTGSAGQMFYATVALHEHARDVEPDDLIRFCRQRLPADKLPKAVHVRQTGPSLSERIS